ncbi:MAG: SprT-like domain-containing protein [Pirellulaceae bacterium]|nr:SprT-like domain-containing protein [Pirellulaceae bacterium]
MRRTDAEQLARDLMRRWRCDGWDFKWSHGKRQLGCAVIRKHRLSGKVLRRQLRLSCYLVDLNDEPEVRETILHEIAHIKAGIHNGHNQVWKRWCHRVGAKPQRCYRESEVKLVEANYLIDCANCKKVVGKRMRKVKDVKKLYCKKCGPSSLGKLRLRVNPKGSRPKA